MTRKVYTKYTKWRPKYTKYTQKERSIPSIPGGFKTEPKRSIYQVCQMKPPKDRNIPSIPQWSPKRNKVQQVSPKGRKYTNYPWRLQNKAKTKCTKYARWSPKRNEVYQGYPNEALERNEVYQVSPKGTKYTKYPWRLQNKAKTKYIPTINHLNQ